MISTKHPCVEFSAQDRCDRCGAQAYVLASRDGLELLFCVHHGKKYNTGLEQDGWQISYDYIALEHITPVSVPA